MTNYDLVIVGGGFSGLCTAVMAAKEKAGLSVLLIDDSERPGLGIAYSTEDPNHRLNAPALFHSIVPSDLTHLMRWCDANNIVDDDPDSVTPFGLFIRRADYAKYLQEHLSAHVETAQSRVESVTPGSDQLFEIRTSDQQTVFSKTVVLAIGNPPQHIPAPMQRIADHGAMITNPWDRAQIGAINTSASVLIVGSSLTAADQICSLIGQGHHGAIQVISRNGLRPTQWPAPEKDAELPDVEAIMNDPPQAWITEPLSDAYTVRNLTRAIRKRIEFLKEQNEPWEPGFDEVRNKIWQIWPKFSVKEKQRFLRRLRPFYDIHRFRIPPQTAQMLTAAQERGQLHFRKAALVGLQIQKSQALAELEVQGKQCRESFDAVINCTGFELTSQPPADSLCGLLLNSGHLALDPCGIGYQTDQTGRCLDNNGKSQASLRMVGPQTAGTWGDPLGAVFIGFQIQRMMPDLLEVIRQR